MSSKTLSHLLAVVTLLIALPAASQSLQGAALIETLQGGGYVLVMRHASSPSEPPDAATANQDNPARERQLDATGRRDATEMGEALRRLQIPIDEASSSPTYRTVETARYLEITNLEIREYLGSQSMQESSEAAGEQLRDQTRIRPTRGNRLLITHSPNIAAAFPDLVPATEQGEVLVFDANSTRVEPVARVKISAWLGF